MSRRTVHQLVADMTERIDRIEAYVAGFEREAFVGDAKTSDAVVRNLEVIAEAASRLPSSFRDRCSAVPWARIVGLRNRIVHAYFDVDLDLVWQIVRVELPELKAQLAGLALEYASDDRNQNTA